MPNATTTAPGATTAGSVPICSAARYVPARASQTAMTSTISNPQTRPRPNPPRVGRAGAGKAQGSGAAAERFCLHRHVRSLLGC